jgi:phage baseplate assembly protein W
MPLPRYRAWRFVHPDFDAGEPASGLRISTRGRVETVDAYLSVRQAILLLLTTRPGERVMRPDYGCHLSRLVFSPNDDTSAGLAMHYVRQALERWETRVEILRLDAGRNPQDPARMDILLEYRLRATARTERLLFPLYLSEAEV